MNSPSIVAVLPHFLGDAGSLDQLVHAVLHQSGAQPEGIVIVANNPDNQAFTAVAQLPGVSVLEPGFNMGYVGALEWARQLTAAEFLWVLQEDLVPMPNCLEHLLDAFVGEEDSPPLAVASPIEIDSVGRIVPIDRIARFDIDTGHVLALSPEEKVRKFEDTSVDDSRVVRFVSLSGALIRTDALRAAGGFDVSLWPLQYVDVDACIAVQRAGFAVALVREAAIRHDRSVKREVHQFHKWKYVANTRNPHRLVSKYASGDAHIGRATPHVPVEILEPLVHSMSAFTMDYAQWVHARYERRITWQAKRVLRRIKRLMR